MNWVSKKQLATGLEYLAIDTPLCQAKIFLQGAQIEYFQPKGKAPLLWSSQDNDYAQGVGIRGGIPICWPWFSGHQNPDWPAHGFARIKLWQVTEIETRGEQLIIKMVLPKSEFETQYWPHNTELSIEFILGDSLTVSLTNINKANETIAFTQALHSYFPITDIHKLKVTGLEGSNYIEFDQGPIEQDATPVHFDRETDRVYNNLSDTQLLHTQNNDGEAATIKVTRESSHSAVLWNPWIDKSIRLSRFNAQDYLSMVCLEAANVRDDAVTLAPNESHTLSTTIGWL